MPLASSSHRSRRNLCAAICATIIAALVLAATLSAQAPPPEAPPQPPSSATPAPTTPPSATPQLQPFAQLSEKYPGLVDEFRRLFDRGRHDVTLPKPRTSSDLLQSLPASTTVYAAGPNYGDALRQSLAILRQELHSSDVLRKWWTEKDAPGGPKFEDTLEKVSRLYDYLGDETVLTVARDGQHPLDPEILFAAQVRKDGLATFLTEWVRSSPAANPFMRILTPQDLPELKETPKGNPLLVLVGPKIVVAGYGVGALRTFYQALQTPSEQLASSPFGKRIAEAYAGGATVLVAADVHELLKAETQTKFPETRKSLERTGLATAQYLVWKRGPFAGEPLSGAIAGQGELSFAGPRQGVAAWLAKPGPMGSLDFVSPKATAAVSILLADLPQIYDDLQVLGGPSNAGAFGAVAGGEKALHLSVKSDLLQLFSGEFTLELDSFAPSQPPDWKVIAKVRDAAHLQNTVDTLLALAKLPTTQNVTPTGESYSTMRLPGQHPTDITYAFVDGYLIVTHSAESLANTIRLHGTADSLAHDPTLAAAALPTGQSTEASALFYQNSSPAAAGQLQALSPELSALAGHFAASSPASVTRFYGEPNAIREIGSPSPLDAGAMFIVGATVAAVTIPNLLRAPTNPGDAGVAAHGHEPTTVNEVAALRSIRALNDAQGAYSSTYPDRGFAPSLAALGYASPNSTTSPGHAGSLGQPLLSPTCTAGKWCVQSGYQFQIAALCLSQKCLDYRTFATPVDAAGGTRSFCSTSDGIIHVKFGPPLTAMPTAQECHLWPRLN